MRYTYIRCDDSILSRINCAFFNYCSVSNIVMVLPLELLSIAGLKRDEAAEVFGFLGFNVTKETQTVTTGEETKETETLMIQPKFKKHKKAPKEEKIDETSPFAALAALKKK